MASAAGTEDKDGVSPEDSFNEDEEKAEVLLQRLILQVGSGSEFLQLCAIREDTSKTILEGEPFVCSVPDFDGERDLLGKLRRIEPETLEKLNLKEKGLKHQDYAASSRCSTNEQTTGKRQRTSSPSR
mmetsp:Transcript_9492/g.23384  ORF Transcript_9492/g.23384 Transcript_9492/m.23384 type:complete len:128 (-) Transcript_9492:98-481(-)